MKLLAIIFTILIFGIITNPIAANKDCNLKILAHCDYFVCDNFGNIYTINEEKVTKYDSTGKITSLYDSKSHGRIGAIDITNPLKIMLFYPESQQIQFIDRNLAPINESIDLSSYFSDSFTLGSTSYSNGLWLFSLQSSTLYHTNHQIRIVSKIENLNQELPQNFTPNQLLELDNNVYLGDPHHGIIVLDRWGAILKKVLINYVNTFNVVDQTLFFHRMDTLFSYTPTNFEEKSLFTAPFTIKNAVVTKTQLYLQSESDTIYRYPIQ